jgi:hypothetical protein
MMTESLVTKICEKYSKTTVSKATLNEDSLQFHASSASQHQKDVAGQPQALAT